MIAWRGRQATVTLPTVSTAPMESTVTPLLVVALLVPRARKTLILAALKSPNARLVMRELSLALEQRLAPRVVLANTVFLHTWADSSHIVWIAPAERNRARARATAHHVPLDHFQQAVRLPAPSVMLESTLPLDRAHVQIVLLDHFLQAERLSALHALLESSLLALVLTSAPHATPARSAVEEPPSAPIALQERKRTLILPCVISVRRENTLDCEHPRVLTAILELTPIPRARQLHVNLALQAQPPTRKARRLAWRVVSERWPRPRA
mmetsp:Transcript_20733/g.38736  ORF Transcript_20733/g.38736 Transcript_20733/m.38736 type:complete len:267 (-) Transcript_20733:439-1239(-)